LFNKRHKTLFVAQRENTAFVWSNNGRKFQELEEEKVKCKNISSLNQKTKSEGKHGKKKK
jgi:hypothetical protein